MKMLFLDFCNVEEWSLGAISELYKKNKIFHTKHGELRGWEDFCKTKHDEKWFYFEDIPQGKTPWAGISPDEPEFGDLWKKLRKSQDEYRSFLDKCIEGEVDVNFINKSLERISGEKSIRKSLICFAENIENPLMPKINYKNPYLSDIESYVDWKIILIALGETGPKILGHLFKCQKCQKYSFYERKTRKFCSAKCRLGFHYEKDMKTGKRQNYHKKWIQNQPGRYK